MQLCGKVVFVKRDLNQIEDLLWVLIIKRQTKIEYIKRHINNQENYVFLKTILSLKLSHGYNMF